MDIPPPPTGCAVSPPLLELELDPLVELAPLEPPLDVAAPPEKLSPPVRC